MQSDPLEDEDIMKIDRLQLINASARYQLLSANQQLLDFHLSRIMQSKLKNKTANLAKKKQQILKESSEQNQQNVNGPTSNGNHLNTITEEFRESIRGAARNNNVRNTDGDDDDSSGREIDGQTLNSVRSGRSFRQGGNGTPGN